jgi:hypothetical protein
LRNGNLAGSTSLRDSGVDLSLLLQRPPHAQGGIV